MSEDATTERVFQAVKAITVPIVPAYNMLYGDYIRVGVEEQPDWLIAYVDDGSLTEVEWFPYPYEVTSSVAKAMPEWLKAQSS